MGREVLGLGLNSLGYSLNSKDPQQLKRQWISSTNWLQYQGHCGGRDEGYMIQNNAASVRLSLGSSQMLEKNLTSSVVPTGGYNLWFDNMVIPKNRENQDAAYAFYQLYVETRKCSEKCGVCRLLTPNHQQSEMLPERLVQTILLSWCWYYETLGSLWEIWP